MVGERTTEAPIPGLGARARPAVHARQPQSTPTPEQTCEGEAEHADGGGSNAQDGGCLPTDAQVLLEAWKML